MTVVLDASVLIVLATADPRKSKAQDALRRLADTSETLHAPILLPYEVASGFTRLIAGGALSSEQVTVAWNIILGVPLTYHPMERPERVVEIARQLRRQSAYDAAYLALAEQLEAEMWTFDGPLTRNAASLGFRVRLIE